MADFESILSDLKHKKYAPVYFLCGDEPYYIDKISDFIEDKILDENEKSFNQTVIYGRDVDGKTIASEAKRYPMMSEHTVVIVKEAQDTKKIEEILSYVENPLPSTLLVICYKYKTPDKRTAFGKAISKLSVYLESKRLYDNQLPSWISTYAKGCSLSVHPAAAQLLAEFLGNDLGKIANEINKLSITLPKGTEISETIVKTNIGNSREYTVFELQNTLGQRDLLKANKIINYFAANIGDNHPSKVIAALYNYFVKVMIYHKVPDKGMAAGLLKVNPYFVKDYQLAASNYSPGKLVNIMSVLRDYDLKSKGVNNSGTDQGELLREMIYKILH